MDLERALEVAWEALTMGNLTVAECAEAAAVLRAFIEKAPDLTEALARLKALEEIASHDTLRGTDAKPDPLLDVRKVYSDLLCGLKPNLTDLRHAIAAWEKERARFNALQEKAIALADDTDYATLRAAVEKVRDELRSDVQIAIDAGARGDESGFDPEDVERYADALDAALRGGE